jgi:hypothetical protein
LNFAGGSDVRVHLHPPMTFSAFTGSMVGPAYADKTQVLKQTILEAMRADYAAFNIQFASSDSGPPAEPYSTVHFGGKDSGLLGLADAVDEYNTTDDQACIVFVETFSAYQGMGLSAEQMGVMIANVGSHELGHLLGLYHTKDPDDLMDTTGSAWDLSQDQQFRRAPLEESVFPTGMEDCPRLLEIALGPGPQSAKAAAGSKLVREPAYKLIRRFARQEIRHACGTCLHLEHPAKEPFR